MDGNPTKKPVFSMRTPLSFSCRISWSIIRAAAARRSGASATRAISISAHIVYLRPQRFQQNTSRSQPLRFSASGLGPPTNRRSVYVQR